MADSSGGVEVARCNETGGSDKTGTSAVYGGVAFWYVATMVNAPFSPATEARRAQRFPVLEADEIARMHRFGKLRRFAAGERVLETGKVSPGIYVVLSPAATATGTSSWWSSTGPGASPPS